MKNDPVCKTVLPWLRANLGNYCLGCLTGYSGRALAAAVQTIAAYNSSDTRHEGQLLSAFRAIVMTLDEPERHLVYQAIAHQMNWCDRASLWRKADCPPLVNPPARCKFE